ncbi:break repair meiotic recombinase recruitment factor 1 isoform X2 [Podarcis muralis]
MSKRKKGQIPEENKEHGLSKANKCLRRKLTEGNDPEMPVQNFHSDNSSTKVIVSGTIQECQRNSLANMNTENLVADLDTSKASFERKEQDNMKVFVPLSQGGKLVPKFTKPRKTLAEKHGNFGGAVTTGTENGDCMDRNITSTAKNYVENTVASSETPEAADSLVTKVKDAGEQVIIHCEELSKSLDVKMQDEDKIGRINNGGANSGLADSCQGTGTASNLQESICEKEVSDNKDVDGLSLEPFKCQFVKEMSISMLAEDSVTDHIKSTPHEEHLDTSNKSMDKNKAFHDITDSDDVKEANWTKNRSCKDASLIECMFSQTQKENNRIYFPLETGLSFLTPGEQGKHLNTSNVSRDGDTDVKKADQDLPYRRGETEEQNVICSSTEISEQVTLCSSAMSEKGTDKLNLWSSGKPVEQNGMSKTASQSNPCMEEIIVAEENSVQGQNTSGKDVLDIQSMSTYLEKKADISESKCEQVFETSDMFLPQPDGVVHPESSTISVQAVICSEETGRNKKESEMKARSAKSTTGSPDPEVPVLQTQRKNGSERLVSDTKQSEFSRCDLEPAEIREVLSGISQQNLTETAKAETNPTENCSADIYMEGKEEIVTCKDNKSKPAHEENGLSTVKVLPAPLVVGDPGREMNAGSEMQKSLLVLGTGCSRNAPSGLDTMMTQTCSPCTDSLSLDMEILSNSQLLGIFEFPPHKTSFLDNPHSPSKDKSDQCAVGEQSGIKTPVPAINLIYPNSDRNEVTEGVCDPYKQEDATDVVCGLIKELSNLNRLIMSTHRDLDSFKKLKFRRNRQSRKLVPHSNVTSTLCTIKKKREI